MCKKLFLFLTLVLCSIVAVQAQSIQLIANPDANTGIENNAIVYNSNLYFQYLNPSSGMQLAKYNGTAVSIISNPDAGQGFQGSPIVYNGNLYFQYMNTAFKFQLAKYDGTSITLITNPDAGTGFTGYPIIYNGNLYFRYQNASSKVQLAKYNGTSMTLINNPDAGGGCTGFPIIYNGNLCFSYNNANFTNQLAKYDGTSIALINNPDVGTGFTGYPIVYNSNLYASYYNTNNKLQLAKYDGTAISLIANPDAATGFQGGLIVYNGNLYFNYAENTINHLAKYNDTLITVIANPDSSTNVGTFGVIGNPILYNGNLYAQYVNATSINQLAKYDGTALNLIPNPDSAFGVSAGQIVYNGNLYFQYQNANYKFQLAKYNDTTISLIPNPDGAYGVQGNTIQYGNGLYFGYTNLSYNNQLAKLFVCHSDTTILTRYICSSDSFQFFGSYKKQKGTYFHQLTNQYGCDSIIRLRLLWFNNTSSIITHSICVGDSALFNGVYYKTKGTYTIHKTNHFGADSIITYRLLWKPKTSSNFTQTICAGDSVLFNGTYYKQKGIYKLHLTNYVGCDSFVTFKLLWKKTSATTVTQSICAGDSIIFNGKYYKQKGTYKLHFSNYVGCDSLITFRLLWKKTSSANITRRFCLGDSTLIGSVYYKIKGTYTLHNMNYVGCDSTTTIHIYYNNTASITNASICAGTYYTFCGQTYTAAGTYFSVPHSLTNYKGCDSIAKLILTVNNCTRNSSNTNITTQSVAYDEVMNADNNFTMNLYPNPNDGTFTLENNCTTCDKMKVEIFNVSGQLIFNQELENTAGKMNISQSLSSGMYLVRLSNDDNNFIQSKSFVVK